MKREGCWTCKGRVEMPGAKVCNDCWEVERRLDGYLRRGGSTAAHFVREALERVEKVTPKAGNGGARR